jgi:hypothetical protein
MRRRHEHGRVLQENFNGAEHNHYDHGCAVTSHSAQGFAIEHVFQDWNRKILWQISSW